MDLRLPGGHFGMDERTSPAAQPGTDWASCLPCHSESKAWFHHPARFIHNYPIKFSQKLWRDQLTFKDHIAKTARSCWFALQNIRKIRPHNFLSRPLSFVSWNTAMLFWLDFHHAQPNLYKWFRMQRHDWSSTSPKGPTLHPSLSPCTGYLLWLALSLRHWCLRIEQPQVQPPSTSTHSYRSTFTPEAWDLKVSDASWCHHREAQNHFPEHFRSLFLAGAMIFPTPSGMLNAWQFSTAENSPYSSRFNCIPQKKNAFSFLNPFLSSLY